MADAKRYPQVEIPPVSPNPVIRAATAEEAEWARGHIQSIPQYAGWTLLGIEDCAHGPRIWAQHPDDAA